MKIETTAGRRIITRDTEIGENLLLFFFTKRVIPKHFQQVIFQGEYPHVATQYMPYLFKRLPKALPKR